MNQVYAAPRIVENSPLQCDCFTNMPLIFSLEEGSLDSFVTSDTVCFCSIGQLAA